MLSMDVAVLRMKRCLSSGGLFANNWAQWLWAAANKDVTPSFLIRFLWEEWGWSYKNTSVLLKSCSCPLKRKDRLFSISRTVIPSQAAHPYALHDSAPWALDSSSLSLPGECKLYLFVWFVPSFQASSNCRTYSRSSRVSTSQFCSQALGCPLKMISSKFFD